MAKEAFLFWWYDFVTKKKKSGKLNFMLKKKKLVKCKKNRKLRVLNIITSKIREISDSFCLLLIRREFCVFFHNFKLIHLLTSRGTKAISK